MLKKMDKVDFLPEKLSMKNQMKILKPNYTIIEIKDAKPGH